MIEYFNEAKKKKKIKPDANSSDKDKSNESNKENKLTEEQKKIITNYLTDESLVNRVKWLQEIYNEFEKKFDELYSEAKKNNNYNNLSNFMNHLINYNENNIDEILTNKDFPFTHELISNQIIFISTPNDRLSNGYKTIIFNKINNNDRIKNVESFLEVKTCFENYKFNFNEIYNDNRQNMLKFLKDKLNTDNINIINYINTINDIIDDIHNILLDDGGATNKSNFKNSYFYFLYNISFYIYYKLIIDKYQKFFNEKEKEKEEQKLKDEKKRQEDEETQAKRKQTIEEIEKHQAEREKEEQERKEREKQEKEKKEKQDEQEKQEAKTNRQETKKAVKDINIKLEQIISSSPQVWESINQDINKLKMDLIKIFNFVMNYLNREEKDFKNDLDYIKEMNNTIGKFKYDIDKNIDTPNIKIDNDDFRKCYLIIDQLNNRLIGQIITTIKKYSELKKDFETDSKEIQINDKSVSYDRNRIEELQKKVNDDKNENPILRDMFKNLSSKFLDILNLEERLTDFCREIIKIYDNNKNEFNITSDDK